MMPLAMPEVELDLSVLEEFDVVIACEHTMHAAPSEAWWHQGDAFYWARAYHQCGAPAAEGLLYALCKPSGDWFLTRHEKQWSCLRCHHKDLGRRMVEVLGPINP